jgi:hypothetical protein
MRQLIFFAALSLAAGAAQAQVHKCVDAGGKTVYSQSPCPRDTRSSTLQRNAPPPPAAKADAGKADPAKAAGPKSAAEMEQDFRKRRLQQEEAQKKDEQKLAESRAKEENCKNARTQLVSLETSRQMRVDENGERRFLDEAEIEKEKDRARRSIQSFCN